MKIKDFTDKAASLFKNLSAFKKAVLIVGLLTIISCVIAYISQVVMQNFPNSADEYAYIFQARNLERFQVYAPIHPDSTDGFRMQRYFYFVHIGDTDDKYYGRFPFGYSLLMVPAGWMGRLLGLDLYWTVNTLFSALTLLLIFFLVKRYFDTATASIALIAAFCNPWFLFTSGSFFSHTTCTFFIALFLYLLLLAIDEENVKKTRPKFLMAGACFGFSILIRFLDPLAFILPSLFIYLSLTHKSNILTFKKVLKDFSWFLIGASICLVILLSYNKALTGHFFTTAYQYFNPSDSGTRFIFMAYENGKSCLDFSKVWEVGYKLHTAPNAKLMFNWFLWGYTLILLPFALYKRRKDKRQVILVIGLFLMPLMVILLYMLYGGPPMNQYGPRYFYSFFVPVSIITAFSISNIGHGKFRLITWPIAAVFVILSFNSIIDKGKDIYENIFDRKNLFRTIEHYDIHNAVVFLLTDSGSMYAGDLTRNSLDFDNDVIICHSMGGHYQHMIQYYPGRSFYEYRYQAKDMIGNLTRLIIQPDGAYYRDLPKIDLSKIQTGDNGLIANFYEGHNFDTHILARIDRNIDFNWGKKSPHQDSGSDHFSVRWDGIIKIDKDAEYTFYTLSDDGVRLFIDNIPIINNWNPHPETENRGEIYLSEGCHLITLEYYEDAFDSVIKLFYSAPFMERIIVPHEKFFLPEDK